MEERDWAEDSGAGEGDLVRLAGYGSVGEAMEHGLVVLAMGEACVIEREAGGAGFDLLVEPAAAPRMAAELELYAEERAEGAAGAVDGLAGSHGPGWGVAWSWVVILVGVYAWQVSEPGLAARAASSNVALLDSGEWWRPFTGLFLHGDPAHLVGNLVGGVAFGVLLAGVMGPWRAWFWILLCGTLGNLTTSLVTHPEPFASIGASTAVFAALGLLAGTGVIALARRRGAWERGAMVRTFAPVIGGVVVLGWWGGAAPGSATDVLGHVFGFAWGVAMGALATSLGSLPGRRAASLENAA